jgi:hypothetical protein
MRPFVIVLAAVLAVPVPVAGQSPDSVSTEVIADGVVHRRIIRAAGPWVINVVEVDLRNPDLVVESEHAGGIIRGRERTSSIARRESRPHHEVLAAVNADFFDLKTGENENNQIVRGQVEKGLALTQSPFDQFDNVHSQFAITTGRKPLIDRFVLDAAWLSRWGPVSVSAVNTVPFSDALVLFNPYYGDTTPRDTLSTGVAELPLALAGRRGDTLLYRVRGPARPGGAEGESGAGAGGTPIPRDGAVLAGYGASGAAVRIIAGKPFVRIVLAMSPRRGEIRTLVGGWPRIVRDGRNVAAAADSVEGTFPSFAAKRHNRTAVGFSRDSTTLYLVAVDGRSKASVGMTLTELGDELLALGAYQALNLDGGGSTTMVVKGRVVNTPTDSTGERAVGNALLVVRK